MGAACVRPVQHAQNQSKPFVGHQNAYQVQPTRNERTVMKRRTQRFPPSATITITLPASSNGWRGATNALYATR
ncbi:hypothetical protein MKX01_015072 [Papaver californicum]|nr:hypothetical protein MKX01_015072 [Papaver californicum]